MAQVIDNTAGAKIGRCLVYYRDSDDEMWSGGNVPLPLTTMREAIASNEKRGAGHKQYRLESVEAREADWKARDNELEEKLVREKRERGGANGTG